MVTSPLIIAAILAVVSLVLLIGGIGLLFWTLWMRWYNPSCVQPGRALGLNAGCAAWCLAIGTYPNVISGDLPRPSFSCRS